MLPEIVRFTKTGGPLTKRIHLDENGKLKSDGSACVMSQGEAWRAPVAAYDRGSTDEKHNAIIPWPAANKPAVMSWRIIVMAISGLPRIQRTARRLIPQLRS